MALFPFAHPTFPEQVLNCKPNLYLIYLDIMGYMCVAPRTYTMKEAERERNMARLGKRNRGKMDEWGASNRWAADS